MGALRLRLPNPRLDPPLPSVSLDALPALAAGDCGDWRGTVGSIVADDGVSAHLSFVGRYAGACGVRDWWLALLDHPAYVHGMFTAYFAAAGGHFAGGLKSGIAPRGATPFATLESPPLYDVMRDVKIRTEQVQGSDGKLYNLRVTPYRTLENKIDGVVLALLDISELLGPASGKTNGRTEAEE